MSTNPSNTELWNGRNWTTWARIRTGKPLSVGSRNVWQEGHLCTWLCDVTLVQRPTSGGFPNYQFNFLGIGFLNKWSYLTDFIIIVWCLLFSCFPNLSALLFFIEGSAFYVLLSAFCIFYFCSSSCFRIFGHSASRQVVMWDCSSPNYLIILGVLGLYPVFDPIRSIHAIHAISLILLILSTSSIHRLQGQLLEQFQQGTSCSSPPQTLPQTTWVVKIKTELSLSLFGIFWDSLFIPRPIVRPNRGARLSACILGNSEWQHNTAT